MDAKALIESGKTALGIELGSTRIKGVLIDLKGRVLAVGIHAHRSTLKPSRNMVRPRYTEQVLSHTSYKIL